MMSRYLFWHQSNDLAGRLRQDPRMASIEGQLARNWRQWLGLTLERVGDSCPRPLSRNRVHDIEMGRSSASVETLLNVIHGLEAAAQMSLGEDDQRRLARFFEGPDVVEARRLSSRQLRDLAAALEGPRRSAKAGAPAPTGRRRSS